MALIDKASLLMVPSTYEAGKLYNVLPSGNRAPDSTGENSGYDQTRADFDFDRGSNTAATRVNADGLIEKYRENLLLQSNQFDTTWSKQGSTLTSGQSGYDGSSDAWFVQSTTANSGHRVLQSISISGVYTFSVYAKAGGYNYLALYASSVGDGRYFNLSNGTIGGIMVSEPADSKIEDVGGGWYRCSITLSATTSSIEMWMSESGTSYIFTGDGTSGVYIMNAQAETGMVATDYLNSTSVTGKAGVLIDLPRIDYSSGAGALLLEPSRQQLVQYSEWLTGSFALENVSVDLNNTTSPEGVQNALKITDDTNTGYHKITDENLFVADGTMRTWSVFVKKGTSRYCVISHAKVFSSAVNSLIFDMEDGVYTNEGNTDYFDIVHDPISMGNGWWRIGFSSDINSSSYDNFSIGVSQGPNWSGNVSYTGDGSLNFYTYGAQLEAGSYVSSYIPNHGESGGVTRAADSCSVTGASDVIGQTEGTLFADVNLDGTLTSDQQYIEINDGTTSNRIYIGLYSIYSLFRVVSGGAEVVNINNTLTIGNRYKMALTYEANSVKAFINGSKIGEDTSASIPACSHVYLNYNANAQIGVNESIIFTSLLTEAEAIALTTL